MSEPRLQIIGRTSSLFTRAPRIVAHELGVEIDLVPIHDITERDPAVYAGNPALKLPSLRRPNGAVVFGALNLCRVIAEDARADRAKRVVWPEDLRDDVSRNAQEMVWHAMSAQVQWVFGTVVNKLPADNTYFVKGRAGFEGALQWIDANLPAALDALPRERALSILEVTLFCLAEHLTFRGTLPLTAYPAVAQLAATFAARESARATAYAFDAPPA